MVGVYNPSMVNATKKCRVDIPPRPHGQHDKEMSRSHIPPSLMVKATKKYRVDIYPPPLMVNATKKCRVDVAWPLEGWAFFKQGDKEIAPCRNGGLKATLFCRLDKATKQCQSDVLLSICHCWNYLLC